MHFYFETYITNFLFIVLNEEATSITNLMLIMRCRDMMILNVPIPKKKLWCNKSIQQYKQVLISSQYVLVFSDLRIHITNFHI